MNKRRLHRAVSFIGVVGLLIVGGFGLRLFQVQRHQYALNRQLIAALMRRDTSQALLLVQEGADPNTQFDPPPVPSLTHLWDYLFRRPSLPGSDSPSAFLIACGATWSSDYSKPETICPESPLLVKDMLRHGAKINAKDKDKQTPLYWATCLDYQQTVSVLLAHGADVNAISKGGLTPLMVACLNESPDITRLLLDHRANVNARDGNGDTVLFTVIDQAIRHHSDPHDLIITDVIPQLLANKADPNLPNEFGITDLQVAQQNDRPEIVTLLWQAGAKK